MPCAASPASIPIARFFSSPAVRLASALRPGFSDGLAILKHPAQAIVICGKNEEMKANMEAQARAIEAKNPGLTFRILGYTNEMHRWMQISDLFIGKPGGLTTAECLACALPMVIVAPIPGQEDRNSDHLLEKGIAIKCNEFTTLAYKIDGLLDHPEILNRMREKRALVRPAQRGSDHRRHTAQSRFRRGCQGRPGSRRLGFRPWCARC